ncbi:hypothetical protein ACSBOB_01575 [Mesorhizobium sp. ASY16-5R]|uniref:hypothetical protein n=1 Tax=Mesorhizobium sp. ASY16-5R TaxID=3445772 RepID=UPI003FA09B27
MPWVRFTDDFDFKPKPAVTLAYLRGDECNVTTACRDAALAAGKGVPLRKASKSAKLTEIVDARRRPTE